MPSSRILINQSGLRGPAGPAGPQGAAGGALGAADVAGATHAASAKATPVDADEMPLVDSAASFAIKKWTVANMKAFLLAYLNGVGIAKWANPRLIDGVSVDGTSDVTILPVATHAATSKTTPVDADELPLSDSAASFGIKKLTIANLKALLSAYLSSNAQTLTNKDLSSGTNTFPSFADATKVPTSRTINGVPLSADLTIRPQDLAGGQITDAQQYTGAVIAAYFDGSNWVDANGVTLVARPTSQTDACVVWIDTTATGAAPVPSFALTGKDLFLQSPGTGPSAPSALLTWYGTGISNGTSLAAALAGTGDSPAVTSIGGTTAPVMSTGGAITPAVLFSQAAAQVCNAHYTIGSTQAQGRARFWIQTPASWYSSSQGIFRFTDASDALLTGVTLRGSGTPGALSINDSTAGNITTTPNNTLAVSTWYRVELVIDQTAGKARLLIYNTTGANIYDSTATTMSVGSSGWAKCIWGPTVSSVTTAMLMAKLKILSDPATPVGTA